MAKFVDYIKIYASAGNGGDGVVRWRQEKFQPKGGPAGGNGGRGGSVYFTAVRDVGLLSKYTGIKEFKAENGETGQGANKHGKNGEDLHIKVPIGSLITDSATGRSVELTEEGQTEKFLTGGQGGLGNLYFKSSTNRSPQQSTDGKSGEEAEIEIELSLVVDVGLVGLPNAGKSTLINALTNAQSKIGAYQFTTLEPHLGDLYGYILADIPGLIEGASENKGLGHRFLRHVEKTKMLLHLVSLDSSDPYQDYKILRNELDLYKKGISEREEWIVLSKKDLVEQGFLDEVKKQFDKNKNRVFVIGQNDPSSIKILQDELVRHLQTL